MNALDKDQAYSPSHFATNVEATLARQADAGRALVARRAPLAGRATASPATRFNLFVPDGDGPWTLMVFIHGGYWQELDATATDFLAQRYLARGMAFASIGYDLAPDVLIETMIEQCVQGLAAAFQTLNEHGGAWSIKLGGHSAGAQLAYWVARRTRLPIDRLLLISGVFDLAPLVDTYVNAPLDLNVEQARALSPLHDDLAGLPPCRVVIAENDPPAFHRQADAFLAALAKADVHAERIELPDCDHFDVLERF
ncbi:alpha/beta hydrolase [Vreelandella malpeensis]|uniref:Alpha/beta hydrolase n=1 Tax=Vreelandella malpeensis TaxID=1172368 RepID=A0ABS8DUQ1_9GAMM|nr:alpha/beta hydrolase [Halomonas malpeensis]MCB8890058.1 alpha/beta hydrolase [Halomonas malpeensis]